MRLTTLYYVTDIPTASSIAQALRERGRGADVSMDASEQSDIEESASEVDEVDYRTYRPVSCGNPFEKTEALGFMVEDKAMVWTHDASAASKTRVAKADALILNVKIHPGQRRLIAHDGIFEALS